jgi:hypothetical protein
LFHADRRRERRTDEWMEGRTDTTKLIVTFHNFANAPKNFANTPKIGYRRSKDGFGCHY